MTVKLKMHASNFGDTRVERVAGHAPTAFRIWKAGENTSDEGKIYFTRESAKKLLAEQAGRGRVYSSDFDHMSLKNDRPATAGRASGYHVLQCRGENTGTPWTEDSSEEPELWATACDWTKDAAEGLAQDPPLWKFYSPAFYQNAKGEIVSYINFALCINPLTHDLPALSSMRAASIGALTMNKKEAAEAYAKLTAEDSTEEEKKEAHAALAKYMAEGEPESDEPKKDKPEGEPEKNAEDKDPEAKSEPKKDAAEGDEDGDKKKEEHARKHATERANAVIDAAVESAVAERMRPIELKAVLDERVKVDAGMPEAFRKHCLSLGSAKELRSLLSVTPHFAQTRNSAPTQGKHPDERPGLTGSDRDELDEGMGIRTNAAKMPTKNDDGTLTIHNITPSQLRKQLATQSSQNGK